MPYLKRFFFIGCTLCTLFLLLSACSQSMTANSARVTPTPREVGPTATANLSGAQHCPVTLEPANMPALAGGNQPGVIYITQDTGNNLVRYDPASETSRTILQLDTPIQSATLSPDGQWVVLVTQTSFSSGEAIQMVRVDGQDLQTLYCSSGAIDTALLSPDQQTLAFGEPDDAGNTLRLLDLTTGQLHTAVSSKQSGYPPAPYLHFLPASSPFPEYAVHSGHMTPLTKGSSTPLVGSLVPFKWQSNTSLYLSYSGGESLDSDPLLPLYLLKNTSLDANQQQSNLQLLQPAAATRTCGYLALTPDNQRMLCGTGDRGLTTPAVTSVSLRIQSLDGSSPQVLYNGKGEGSIMPSAVSHTSAAFLVQQDNGASFWKVNTDGSGLTQLISAQTSQELLGPATISPDGSLYALAGYSSLLIGHLDGGSVQTLSIQTRVPMLVGWT